MKNQITNLDIVINDNNVKVTFLAETIDVSYIQKGPSEHTIRIGKSNGNYVPYTYNYIIEGGMIDIGFEYADKGHDLSNDLSKSINRNPRVIVHL